MDDGSVPEVNIREVRPFLELEHFKVEVIEKRSSAAAGLCSWVLNIVQYHDIVRTVEPKRWALQKANDQLETANLELEEVRSDGEVQCSVVKVKKKDEECLHHMGALSCVTEMSCFYLVGAGSIGTTGGHAGNPERRI